MYLQTLKLLLTTGLAISSISILYLIVWEKVNCELTVINFISIFTYFGVTLCCRLLLNKLKVQE